MSLYRKYRPQNFESLVGQDAIRTTLVSALKLAKVHHAYLFTGPRGTGKTSTARILAKALNCLQLQEATPCENCDICKDIAEGRLIDVIEIDAASNRGIDEMRDLREKINFAPTRAKNKVYIIDEVHMLTKEAFNALLKTLEEPPAQVYFILATTEVHKIPETIISRCQRFDFKRINETTLIAQLSFIAEKENIQADKEALEFIAHHAQGGLRDAIGLMEQLTIEQKLTVEYVRMALGMSDFESLGRLYNFLEERNAASSLAEIAALYGQGFDLVFFNKSFLEYLRKKLLASVEKNENQKAVWLINVIENFQQAYEQARSATIQQLPLEVAIVKSCLGNLKVQESSDTMASNPGLVSGERLSEVTSKPNSLAPLKPGQNIADQTQQSTSTIAQVDTKDAALSTSSTHERTHQGLAPSEKKGSPGPLSSQKNASAPSALNFDTVQKVWNRVGKVLQTPMVKRGFQEARLGRVEDGTVTLFFSAQFYLEKLMQTASRLELENAFEQALGQPVKIAAVYEAVAEKVIGKQEPSGNEKELADTVAGIFGGEVV